PMLPTSPKSKSGSSLLEKIVRLSLSASAVDIASHERAEPEALRTELVPVVQELLEDTLAFFESVLDTYGSDEEPDGVGEAEGGNCGGEVDEILEDEDPGAKIAALAFIARIELRQKLASLRLPENADSWRIIAAAGSGLRQIHKALAALEAVLARAE